MNDEIKIPIGALKGNGQDRMMTLSEWLDKILHRKNKEKSMSNFEIIGIIPGLKTFDQNEWDKKREEATRAREAYRDGPVYACAHDPVFYQVAARLEILEHNFDLLYKTLGNLMVKLSRVI